MNKTFYFKKTFTKALIATAIIGMSCVNTSNAQTTIPRPWFEGFSATGGVPAGFTVVGYWEAGEDPGLPGNPDAMIATVHLNGTSPMQSTLATPNISGILAGDSLKFDYQFLSALQPGAIAGPGDMYYKVFVSTNSGTSYTQLDSVASSGVANWHPKAYPLAAYAGQTVKFKIESVGLDLTGFLILAFDNFSVNGPGTSPPCTPPVVNLGADTILCNGNSLTLNAGNAGATYLWSNNSTAQTLSVTNAGTYWVDVSTAANCTTRDSIVISTSTTPTALTASDITITGTFPTLTFTVNNPDANALYTWDFCDGGNATGPSVTRTFTSSDSCTVEITISNGCGSASYLFSTEGNPNSVNKVNDKYLSLQLYPNPSQNVINLKNETNQNVKRIVIYDILGKEMKTVQSNGNSIEQIYVGDLAPGMYGAIMEFDQEKVLRKFEVLK